MKILKGLLFFVLFLVVLVLVIALFAKKEYDVQREVVINKPAADVYNYVKLQKNQDNYNKWVMQEKRSTFTGTDGTVGFVYAWDSDGKAGKGEQETTKLVEGKELGWEVRFEKPMKGVAQITMLLELAGDNQTKIKWRMQSAMSYPMNIMTLFIDRMLGKDMDESLNNLKRVLEQ